jgi:hypothetical protein
MVTFNIQGKVLNPDGNLGVSNAKVMVYQVGETAPLVEGYTDLEGRYSLDFDWPLDISIHDNRPDVHFKVIQRIDDADTVIYNENPDTDARRNIADILAVDLETTTGVSVVPTTHLRPEDYAFLFTRVGIIGVDEIDTVAATASGYAYPDPVPAGMDPPEEPNAANTPFGATLDIAAWFGTWTSVYRYKVQYSDDGVNWYDITDPLFNRYYQFAIGGGNWVKMEMGPFNEGGQTNVYKLPYVEQPGHPWIFPDLIAKWDTTKVANSTYTLRVKAFKPDATGTVLEDASEVITDASYGELRLRVDNTAPVAKLMLIEHQETSSDPWQEVQVCEIVDFDTGKLRLTFEASDAQGHLRSYRLDAMYGHNKYVSPLPVAPDKATDSYSNHINATRLWDGGSSLVVEYDASGASPYDYTDARMPTCAYQFRLRTSKRTTNGYTRLYWREDTMHITIQRP